MSNEQLSMSNGRKMKPSGVEWIGEIPQEWDTIKVKYTSWLKGRIGWDGLKSTEYVDEGPYLITGTDFDKGVINWDSCVHITEERFNEDELLHILEGDLLITKDGTVGKVAIAKNCPDKVSLNSGVLLIRNDRDFKYHDKFIYFVLISDEFWRWYTLSQTGQSTIKHLYQEQFYNFEFGYPPLDEQARIADFLDRRCAEIDSVIAETKKTVEEYKALRQSIITEAVTKGIRGPRPMKPSGIEWIGEIPEEWEIGKVSYFYKITLGKMIQPEQKSETDTMEPYLCAANVGGNKLKLQEIKTMWFSQEEKNLLSIRQGDLLVVEGGDIASCDIATEEADGLYFQNALHRVRPIGYNDIRILKYYLWMAKSIGHIDLMCNKATIAHFSKEKFLSLRFVVIPQDEQQEIADYLDEKCAEIELIIAAKQSLLEDMEAYKKSVIYEYVTGKKQLAISNEQ